MKTLTPAQQEKYDAFYAATHDNAHLDTQTELLVGLAAAMAMNCALCTEYYLKLAKRNGINKGQIAEVLAKVMAVAAGQKRLQLQATLEAMQTDLDDFSD